MKDITIKRYFGKMTALVMNELVLLLAKWSTIPK